MDSKRVERRLAAILAIDVVGYSRLMGADEIATLSAWKSHRRECIDPNIASHNGRVVKTTGDGMLIEFASVVDAVACAVAIQVDLLSRNSDTSPDRRMVLRIGVNLGDVIVDGDDIFGDGVNVAARLQAMCEPGGVCISRAARDQVRDKLGFVLADLGEHDVKNIARPVRAFGLGSAGIADILREGVSATLTPSGASIANVARPVLALPDKPSIAVLPFANMSGDPSQEYFADGMVEDIITALSRIKWLFVIARTSSFAYKDEAVDIKRIGRELGVRYLLEGSVRKVGQQVRITAQLIDALNGAHLWAERFDGSLEDVFELQDKVALSVAGVIEPALIAAEMRRSAERPTNDLTAYDLYLRALSHAYTWQKEGIVAALELVERAIDCDPHYGPALAIAALCHQNLHSNGWGPDLEVNSRSGIDFAQRALRAANEDPFVLASSAYVLAYFGESIDAAIDLVDRALVLNPSFARGWVLSGWLRLWAGQPEIALRHLNNSLRLSPRARTAGTLMAIGVAHFFSRRFEDATNMLLRSLQEHPGWAPTYRFLASCYAHMGRLDDASAAVQKLSAITNVLVPTSAHWRNREFRDFFLAGLRMATASHVEI